MAAQKVKATLGLKYEPTRFTNLARAHSYADGCIKMHSVVHGCDGYYWIVCGRDFNTLLKAGYEAAPR